MATSYRMHPDVCRFISDAIYDGRLEAEQDNDKQALVLRPDAHPALKPTGIEYLRIEHDACSQRSVEEADLVSVLYADLLKQQYMDRNGETWPMTRENILVIAPYNMQVNLLKQVLPDPHHGALGKHGGTRASYRLHTQIRTQAGFCAGRIRTATIDLSDLKSVPGQLRALFPDGSENIEAA